METESTGNNVERGENMVESNGNTRKVVEAS